MRILEGEQWMVRVFIGESDRWKGRPLADALVERLRKEGFAGATVLRGLAGFGARSVKRLEPILDEMVADGLVTLEKVRVLKYKPGSPRT